MTLPDIDHWDDRKAFLAWAVLANPGQVRVNALIDRYGAGDALRGVLSGRLALSNAEAIIARWNSVNTSVLEQKRGGNTRVITRADTEWPVSLTHLEGAQPWALWCRGAGDISMLDRSVAVVGARACTAYGSHVARTWSAELATKGVTVISGGAFGIDAAAHRGAIARTVCVSAGGVDVAYPRAHAELFEEIAHSGLILSETPPGEQVRRERFLSRNRLIAALAQVTVIVEAAERSGSLNTARLAADLHRHVIGVPGPITSSLSVGVHDLVREHGAIVGSCVDHVLELLDPLGSHADNERVDDPDDFRSWSPYERAVFDALDRSGAMSVDEIVARAGLGRDGVLEGLAGLVHRHRIARTAIGWVVASKLSISTR